MSLLDLQRDFQSWLKTESNEVAARFGEPSRAGLAVYLNNYRAQLLVFDGELSSSTRMDRRQCIRGRGRDARRQGAAERLDARRVWARIR